MAIGDRHGALAKIRRLIQLYPTEGTFIWFYSTLLDDNWDRGTFEIDMQNAINRLHPGLRPFDFMVAAHQALGNQKEAIQFMKQGLNVTATVTWMAPQRQLSRMVQLRENSRASHWNALKSPGGERRPKRLFGHASDGAPLAGELEAAEASALAAARLNPDDIYMLWQAERIASMNKAAQEKSP